MSRKTSTAALDSPRPQSLRKLCRVPRHPAGPAAAAFRSPRPSRRGGPSTGARKSATQRSKPLLDKLPDRHSERSKESLFDKESSTKRKQPFQQAQIAIYQEDVMNSLHRKTAAASIRTIVPVILRITLSLILWTLGAASMNIAAAQTKEHRVVYNFAVDRAKIEDLQHWVNAGHDSWCRDPQLVAAASLQRLSPEYSGLELASLAAELEHSRKTTTIYTFHSLDGHTSYRITLRRYRWLLPVAGSFQKMIWVPERAEIIIRDTRISAHDSPRSAAV